MNNSLLGFATAVGVIALALPAQAQEWSALVEARGFGRGAVVCSNDGSTPSGNYMCLALRCRAGGPLEFGLIVEGGNFGDGSPFGVSVAVDGRPAGSITMRPTQLTGQKQASSPYVAASHEGMLAALRAGSRANLSLLGTNVTLPLRGSGRQIDHALAVCRVPAPQGRAETVGGNLSAADIRADLIGTRLAWGDAETVYLPNGRFEGGLSGRANNGTYRIEADGRLCWQSFVTGCLRFYRRDGALWVKRDDPRSEAVLGRVTIRK